MGSERQAKFSGDQLGLLQACEVGRCELLPEVRVCSDLLGCSVMVRGWSPDFKSH